MRADKTENCAFVSSENCTPETAAIEFQFLLDKARAGGNTIGRHLIQSFAPEDNITPEQAHEIGQKLAAEILGGEYAYVLATHVDREHIHNHFVWCAANLETHKRYVSNKASYHKIQNASDKLCAEYSLSVIEEKSGRSGKSYTEYQADKYGKSWKTILRQTLDVAIRSSGSFDSFLDFMQAAGYEIKHGAHIAFRATGQERFTRAKTVGENYTEERIRERIAAPKKTLYAPQQKPSIDKIIDRSDAKIASSPAYNHWAAKHNLHAMVDTHNYLATHDNLDLAAFEARYAECIAQRDELKSAHEAAERNAVSKTKSITETLKQVKALQTQHAKEMAVLNTEIAEMNRVRANIVTTHGEKFYRDNSQKRREPSL